MIEHDSITKISTYGAASIQRLPGSEYIHILGLARPKARSIRDRLPRRRRPPGAHCRPQRAGQHRTPVSGHRGRLRSSHHRPVVLHQREDRRGFRVRGHVSPLSIFRLSVPFVFTLAAISPVVRSMTFS